MTDRELLEFAAKAAGIPHAICYDAYPEDGFLTAYAKIGKGAYWNPLSDDGDALRLAVKLRIDVEDWAGGAVVRAFGGSGDVFEPLGVDPYAATRRAIVRAAAEIGKAQS